MYDYSKFGYVVVTIDECDCCFDNLVQDLLKLEHRLGRVDSDEYYKVRFKGLLPMKAIERLRLLKDASPYGNGYNIEVDGFDIYDMDWRFNKLCS